MRAVEVAANPDPEDAELQTAYRDARAFSVKSYTARGRDADWKAQAEHFARVNRRAGFAKLSTKL